ncbi:hypothetical protein JCM3765_003944 [Sporobolomyces pararoseus]
MVKAQLVGPCTDQQINDFLATYVPSANSSIRGKYFSVKATKKAPLPPEDKSRKTWHDFIHEAVPYEQEMIDKCNTIKEYAPTRGSKVKGTFSQKQLREMEHAKFHYRVKEISLQHGIRAGKWIAFLNEDEVDEAWSRVVRGIADAQGHLAQNGVKFAKVTSTRSDNFPHMLFVYLEDSYDDANVETVFRILVEQCGFAPTSYKTSAIDILGITSSHESKIAVSLYGKLSFMNSAQVTQAISNYQEHGPAPNISPLTGPPPLPEIDWEFEFVPDTTQTYLSAEQAGIQSHDFAEEEEEEPPQRTTRSRAKKIKLEEEEAQAGPKATSSKVKDEDADDGDVIIQESQAKDEGEEGEVKVELEEGKEDESSSEDDFKPGEAEEEDEEAEALSKSKKRKSRK